jgi:hypothetical protein
VLSLAHGNRSDFFGVPAKKQLKKILNDTRLGMIEPQALRVHRPPR